MRAFVKIFSNILWKQGQSHLNFFKNFVMNKSKYGPNIFPRLRLIVKITLSSTSTGKMGQHDKKVEGQPIFGSVGEAVSH